MMTKQGVAAALVAFATAAAPSAASARDLMVVGFGLAALLEKAFDRSADIAGVLNRRVNAWLRQYL